MDKHFLASARLAVVFIVIMACLFACSPVDSNGVSTHQAALRVSHARQISPLYVAIEKGYFTDENLSIELITAPSSDTATKGLAAGDIDVASVPYSVLFDFEVAAPNNFRIFSTTIETIERPHSYLIVKPEIDDVAQLRGKKIVIRAGANSILQARVILSALGIDPEEVELIQVDRNLTPQLMATEDISAAIDTEPSATVMISRGLGRVLIAGVRPKFIVNPFPTVAYVFSTSFAQTRPAEAEAFRRAYEKAIDYIRAYPEDCIPIWEEYLNLDAETLKLVEPFDYQKYSEIDKDTISRLMNWEIQEGVLEEPLDLDSLYYQP